MPRHLSLALLLAAAAAPALADRPSVVVDSPDFRPLPVAVPALLAAGDASGGDETTGVLRADLVLSGLFDVLDPRGYLAEAGEGLAAPAIKFGRWTSVGAEGLIKARVRREGAGLAADLHVFDVPGARELLQRSVSAPDPRALGHALADEVVRFYGGEAGVFRTHIVAVRRNRELRELVLYDADGRNPRVLLSEAALLLMPAWHPDGDRILVTSYRGGRPELWVYRLSDRSFRRLGTSPWAGPSRPTAARSPSRWPTARTPTSGWPPRMAPGGAASPPAAPSTSRRPGRPTAGASPSSPTGPARRSSSS